MTEALVMIGVLTLVLGAMVWSHARSNFLAQRWARKNGFRLIDAGYTVGVSGPFKWYTTSRGQSLMRVVVEDASGRRRVAHLRCGGFVAGLWSDRVEVRWEDDAA